MKRWIGAAAITTAAAMLAATAPSAVSAPASHGHDTAGQLPGGFKHLVVIYEENHSYDNLYGTWGPVDGRRTEGLAQATKSERTQVAQDGTAYRCLLQNDVNLASPSPVPSTCADPAHGIPSSGFANKPFSIDDHILPEDHTCAIPVPGVHTPANGVLKDSPGTAAGGCTRDLVHRFYGEQYQLNGGKQNRYATGSDAAGLTMGLYDTKALPIYQYLHSKAAPNYVLADHFFQGAFGGSFLNHQWLISGRAPVDTGGATPAAAHSVLDANGMATSTPLYTTTNPAAADKPLTQACADGNPANYAKACGNFAVNTVQPSSAPSGSGAKIPLIDDAKYPNIGDRLSDAGVSWNWYSGGWDDAAAGQPGPLFQYHHQPFNYFADYAPGKPGRAHLQDETTFLSSVDRGTLPTVSFVKPYGAENEHPGYSSEHNGSSHLVDLLKAITSGPDAESTLVVVTYDEFGGQWDHVSPPGQGSSTRGAHDAFGPGTRIPALVISTSLKRSAVDHTIYDTTSIIATIERSFGLKPVGQRDARVNDLTTAVWAGGRAKH